MSTHRKIVDYIIDQIASAGTVTAKPMFGEYGVYCDGKMIAIIGNDQLFIKLTPGGRSFATEADVLPPYPQAKPYLLIDPDRWDDRDWLTGLARITAAELPVPRSKRAKRRAGPG